MLKCKLYLQIVKGYSVEQNILEDNSKTREKNKQETLNVI